MHLEGPQTGKIYLRASSFLAKLVKGITVSIYILLKWFQTNLQYLTFKKKSYLSLTACFLRRPQILTKSSPSRQARPPQWRPDQRRRFLFCKIQARLGLGGLPSRGGPERQIDGDDLGNFCGHLRKHEL